MRFADLHSLTRDVPLAALVLWICYRHLPKIRGDSKGSIDWAGALLVIAGLGTITWSLIEAPSRRGPLLVIVAMAGVACLVALIVVEEHSRQPLVPMILFRSRTFTGANVLTLLLYAALSGAMFLLPFELIQIRHYTPSEAGAAFLPLVATMSLLSPLSGARADRRTGLHSRQG